MNSTRDAARDRCVISSATVENSVENAAPDYTNVNS